MRDGEGFQQGNSDFMSNQVQVIVNADDLGIGREVNDAIFEMIGLGHVTSATLMANGPQVEHAIARLADFPQASFGIHLNLTEFQPISGPKGLQSLLRDDGEFHGQISQVKIGQELISAVARELGAQIEFLRSRNVGISHFDSHHHVHTLPWLFPVVKYLQIKFRIRRARITWNAYDQVRRPSRALYAKKCLYNFALRNLVRTVTTEGFSDLPAFIENAKSERISPRTYEIMVHPGASKEEDALLTSAWKSGLPYSIQMINYLQLR